MLERIGQFLTNSADTLRARIALMAIIFVVLGSADFIIEWGLTKAQVHLPAHGAIHGVIVGSIAALLSWFLCQAAGRERLRVRLQLEREARLNHEIRNALEVIGQAGYMIPDLKLKSVLSDSVKRIDLVLRQRAPQETEPQKQD